MGGLDHAVLTMKLIIQVEIAVSRNAPQEHRRTYCRTAKKCLQAGIWRAWLFLTISM